jgi:hypothetical protein
MIPLLRYLAADALRSQQWAAPVLLFLAAVAIIAPPNSSPLVPTMTMSAAALFPAALWLTVVVNHSEDPVQTRITGVTAGGPARVRFAKLATAYLGCVPLAGVALTWTATTASEHLTGSLLSFGVLEHLLTALAGVVLGALVSRPLRGRAGWTVLAGVGICLAQLLVPRVPPVHPLLRAFADRPVPNPWPVLAVTAGETVLLAAAAITVAHLVGRSRA